jgi:folate-binding Fe-S cluster repair protein YgfZ
VDDRAVHYDKGCYLGQEAMAKIHFRGKVNRRLATLRGSSPLRPGQEILHEDKKIGSITSSANGCALGLVRYDVPSGTKVTVGDIPATIEY